MDASNTKYGRISRAFELEGLHFIHILSTVCLQSDMEVAAANVLDLFAMIDPSKMTATIWQKKSENSRSFVYIRTRVDFDTSTPQRRSAPRHPPSAARNGGRKKPGVL